MFSFCCPQCKCPLEPRGSEQLFCTRDHLTFFRENGIWRFLSPIKAEHYSSFVSNYEQIRHHEGWDIAQENYLRCLPFSGVKGPHAFVWKVRKASYIRLLKSIITPLSKKKNGKLNILDAGAGNCWLSHQLTAQGHHCCATDIIDHSRDGLGAHTCYETHFDVVQADFDELPLCPKQFDLVIFNGSFHYSQDYGKTMGEALSLLKDDGIIVILDSPFFTSEKSGEMMVRDSERHYHELLGQKRSQLDHEHFLCPEKLQGEKIPREIRWYSLFFFQSITFHFSRFLAKIRGQRERASFPLIIGVPGCKSQELPGQFKPSFFDSLRIYQP